MFLLAISFCTIPWWLLAFLPFLLGLLFGWLLRGGGGNSEVAEIKGQISGYKTRISGLEMDLENYNTRIAKLDAELEGCKGKLTALDEGGLNWKDDRAELNSQIALLQGQLREKASSSTQINTLVSDSGDGRSTIGIVGDNDSGDGGSNDSGNDTDGDSRDGNSNDSGNDADGDSGDGNNSDSGNDADSDSGDGNSRDSGNDADGDSGDAGNNDSGADADGDSGDRSSNDSGEDGGGSSLASAAAGFAAGSASSSSTTSSGIADLGGSGGGGMHAYAKALGSDNLQIVEGIGTKMSELLKNNGINTWSELGSQTPQGLRSLLDGVNESKYRIIDPSTWAQQSSLAAADKWDDLIALQKNLDGGKKNSGGTTDAKVEKMLIKVGAIRRFKKDDLTAVEGIGPKTAQLLKDQGIETWQVLSETAIDRIQGILNDAGSRFKLSDPGTWPKQAGMAARGEWDELQAYQDFLDGGKA